MTSNPSPTVPADPNLARRREVLVVGAGPVGLVTALLAAGAGLDVEVIDKEWRIAARSYACALHPHSLELLDRFGVLPRALEMGVRVDTLAFYEGLERRAEVNLGLLPARFPFVLVLYQDDLEGLLEDALRDQHGRRVGWGRRLEGFAWEAEGGVAIIERLQHAATGDAEHRWEEVVDRRSQVPTRFVVGADGPRSKLAHLMGTGSETMGDPAPFAIYEFEPLTDAGREIRVALDSRTSSTLWPLPGGTCRWTLETTESEDSENAGEAHESTPPLEAPVGGGGRRRLVERIQQVAPWFSAGVHNVDWAMRLDFPRRVANQFGRGACWLLGDAAHQTLPAGAQSMNLAFREAEDWVRTVRSVLRENAPASALGECATTWQGEWRRLLGLSGGIEGGPEASPWVRANAGRLLPCLPASREHLEALLPQLGLRWT